MPKAHSGWRVLPHGPVEELAENLRRVEGTIPGMSLRRVMIVARSSGAGTLVYSPIALEEAAMKSIEAWGTPSTLVVPSAYHRLDAPAFKRRYPSIRVLAPRGVRAKVHEVLPVDGVFEDFPADAVVRFEPLRGIEDREGAMLVRSSDGLTLVLCDVVMNMDRKRDVLGFLFTTVLGSAPGPRVSRLAKLALVKDRRALREDLERLAALPDLTRLVVAHEKVAHGPEAAAALRAAAQYL